MELSLFEVRKNCESRPRDTREVRDTVGTRDTREPGIIEEEPGTNGVPGTSRSKVKI